MKKKTYGYIGMAVILLMLMVPNIPAKEVTSSSNDIYPSGWIVLVSQDIRGMETGIHFWGIQDLNITIHGGNDLILRTRPIWGTLMLSTYVDLHIQMAHFFGIVDIQNIEGVCKGEIIGICQDVSWEKI